MPLEVAIPASKMALLGFGTTTSYFGLAINKTSQSRATSRNRVSATLSSSAAKRTLTRFLTGSAGSLWRAVNTVMADGKDGMASDLDRVT